MYTNAFVYTLIRTKVYAHTLYKIRILSNFESKKEVDLKELIVEIYTKLDLSRFAYKSHRYKSHRNPFHFFSKFCLFWQNRSIVRLFSFKINDYSFYNSYLFSYL